MKEIGDKIEKLPESKWPENTIELVNSLWLDTNAFKNADDLTKEKNKVFNKYLNYLPDKIRKTEINNLNGKG